eukprot:9731501-Lingulodinium_polyedra.AAC.1
MARLRSLRRSSSRMLLPRTSSSMRRQKDEENALAHPPLPATEGNLGGFTRWPGQVVLPEDVRGAGRG